MSVFVIGEIGINHNGDLEIAKKLIDGAADAGADAVKFQKRTIERVYTKEYLEQPRESLWGNTQRDQKKGLELDEEGYREIDVYCKKRGIEWFASAWDTESQLFLRKFSLKYNKIASAMIGCTPLIKMVAEEKKHTFISTGMSTMQEIEKAIAIFRKAGCPFELMHCNSSYPAENDQVNLLCINTLRKRFNCNVGYSGHERGLQISLAAVALGATSIERHITLDRTMYGSDQAASIELHGFARLVRDIRVIESALGDGIKRVYKSELAVRDKLLCSRPDYPESWEEI